MKRCLFFTALFCAVLYSYAADWDGISVPADAGTGYTWELQSDISDDFNYNASFSSGEYASRSNFGPNNQWYNFYHNAWDGPGYTYWDNSNVSVDGDNLVITVGYTSETSKGGSYGVASGCVTSNNTVTYPVFVEASLSVANISLASCFWLLSPDDTEEIDIIENYGGVDWYKNYTHISHHSFVRDPFTDYQPRDVNSWYTVSEVTAAGGWGDYCWNGGNRQYMRMGVNWIGPKHWEYYIDGELVRVMYYNAIATNVSGTWQYTFYNSVTADDNGYYLPTDNISGYTDVTTYATSSSFSLSTLQAASSASNGYSVIDPGWFQGGDDSDIDGNGVTVEALGFTKDLEIIINMESQSWLTSYTPSYADLTDASKNQMKVDWVRVYKPVVDDDSGGGSSVTGVTITPTSISMDLGETAYVTGQVIPTDATDQGVWFTSSNTNIVTVNSSGEVYAVSEGTATITVTSSDGNFTAISTVTVTSGGSDDTEFTIEAEDLTSTGGTYNDGYVSYGVNVVPNYGINYVNSGDWAEYSMYVSNAGEYQIEYQISTPMDDTQVQISIDGTTISTDDVTNNGDWDSYIGLSASNTADLSSGSHTVLITASSSSDWQWNLDKITFTRIGDIDDGDDDVPVTGVTVTPTSLSLSVGATGYLTGAVTPSNATVQTMTFTSNNTSVATVNQSGEVTAVSAGTATITVTSTDGGYTATSAVTVTSGTLEQYAYPSGIAHSIPGSIESVNFDVGDNGVAYYDATSGNSGSGLRSDTDVDTEYRLSAGNVGWIATGEWLEYTVNVASAGNYTIDALVASTGSNGAFHIQFGGVDKTGTQYVSATGGWGTFTTISVSGVTLSAGEQVMRVYMDGGSFNLGTMTFTKESDDNSGGDGEIIRIEAEDLTETGGTYNDGYVSYGVNVVANYGINYVNNGDWATYNVTIPEDGAYEIVYYISSPIDGSTIDFSVNDTYYNTTTVTNNGSWEDYYALTASNTANFTAGDHIVTLTAGTTDWTWNLDYFTLQRVSDMKGAPAGINSSLADLSIYPNPATDVLNIYISSELEMNAGHVIYNSIGKVVKTGQILSNNQEILINELPSGLYIINIINGNEYVSKRLIKK